MEQQEFLNLVAEILEIQASQVSLDDSLDLKGWDSLSNLGFIAEIDERFDATIDADELANAVSVKDLYEIVLRTIT